MDIFKVDNYNVGYRYYAAGDNHLVGTKIIFQGIILMFAYMHYSFCVPVN